MTLVVAIAHDDAIQFFADTQLTLEHKRAQQCVTDAMLKVVYSKGLGIAFAGASETANEALKDWYEADDNSFATALEIFTHHSIRYPKSSPKCAEFLLASVGSVSATVIKIVSGSTERGDLLCIGNEAACDDFEAHRKKAGDLMAFGEILLGGKYRDVGGLPVEAVLTRAGFHYPAVVGGSFGEQPFTTRSTEYVPVPEPAVERGQLSYSRQPVYRDDRVVGVAFYTPTAPLGAIFVSEGNVFPEAHWLPGARPLAFREHAESVLDIQLHSGFPENHELFDRAEDHARKGEFREALEVLVSVIPLPSVRPVLLLMRSDLHVRLGEHEEAGALLDLLLADDPQSGNALVRRGYLRFLDGELHGAEDDFSRLIEVAPGSTHGWQWRANVRILIGDHKGAESDMLRLRAICREEEE